MSRYSSEHRSYVKPHTAAGFAHLDILIVAECVGTQGARDTPSAAMNYRMSRSTRATTTVFPVRRRMTRVRGTSDAPGRTGLQRGPTGTGTIAAGPPIRHGKTAAGIVVPTRRVHQWITRGVPSIGLVMTMSADAVSSQQGPSSPTATSADKIVLGTNARLAPRRYATNVTNKVQSACVTNLRSVIVTIDSRL